MLQTVLAQITNKLAPHVSQLTVQVFKEDWSMPVITSGTTSPTLHSVPAFGYVAKAHGHVHRHHEHHQETESHAFLPVGHEHDPLVANVTSVLQIPSQNVA